MWQAVPRTHHSDDMKRRLLIIAVFLFAGAVVNVTVAWGCWLGSDANLRNKLSVRKRLPGAAALKMAADMGFAPQINPDGIPIVYVYGTTIHCGAGTALDVLQINQVEIVERPYAEVVADLEIMNFAYANARRVQAGWPTHTMRGYEITVKNNETGEVSAEYRWAFSALQGKPPFPLLPIWPGFAACTLLYAAVLWLLICGPLVPLRVIRVSRVKRGRCPACAYPRGQSGVCSECGRPLPVRSGV